MNPMPSRRQALRLAGALTVAGGLAGVGHPARSADKPRKLAILSMVGHDISIVESTQQIGSRLPPRREALPVDSGMFDQRSTLALDKAARAFVPAENIVLMSAQGQMWSELQRDALAGDAGMKDMIATVTDVARRGNCSQALVLMKHRGVAKLKLYDTSIGHGTLEGLGFYIDTTAQTVSVNSRSQSIGVLAPYAYMKLLHIDADKVTLINSYYTEGSQTYVPGMGDMRNPWEAFTAEKKAHILLALMEQELARLVPKVMKPG